MEVTARAPELPAAESGTIRVPGFSGAKLFLLQTGIRVSTSGARVRGCRTFAPA